MPPHFTFGLKQSQQMRQMLWRLSCSHVSYKTYMLCEFQNPIVKKERKKKCLANFLQRI